MRGKRITVQNKKRKGEEKGKRKKTHYRGNNTDENKKRIYEERGKKLINKDQFKEGK